MRHKNCFRRGIGASINYVEKQEGKSGPPNINDTTQAYLVNLSTGRGR